MLGSDIHNDLRSRFLSLTLKLFLPRRITIGAPRRHRPLTRALDPAIGINAGRKAELAGAVLIWIFAHF
jgi:hypothetical protein